MRGMPAWPLLCFALLFLGACGGPPPTPAAPAVPALPVLVLARTDGAHRESLVGSLSAQRSAEVRARVSGILLERVYSEGSDVAAGALLFRIDPAPLQAELKAREAELASARARAANARAKAERHRDLAARGLLPAQELEDSLAQQRIADAAERESRAQVDKARLQLGYAEVRAPIAGRVGKALVTEGALVGERESTWLTLVEQIDALLLDFHISVASWEILRGMQARGVLPTLALRLPDGRPYAHPATLQFADQAVDPRTGTIALRAQVPNPERQLLPGMFVGIEVDVGAGEPVFRLPQTAVLRDGQGAYVFLLDAEGKVQRRDLQLEGSVGRDWIVRDGLAEGERLVTGNLQRLRPGMAARAAD